MEFTEEKDGNLFWFGNPARVHIFTPDPHYSETGEYQLVIHYGSETITEKHNTQEEAKCAAKSILAERTLDFIGALIR